MRTVAAIPALGLLAGSVAGLLAPDIIQPIAFTLLICGAGTALWAWRISSPRAVAMATAAAFAAGGALLAADAWQKAWRPTLRIAFEELARGERRQAAIDRRVLPEDDEAFATVTGVLRSDAARTLSGVSLSIDVDGILTQQQEAPAAMPGPPARQAALGWRAEPRTIAAGSRRPARHRRRIPRAFIDRRMARRPPRPAARAASQAQPLSRSRPCPTANACWRGAARRSLAPSERRARGDGRPRALVVRNAWRRPSLFPPRDRPLRWPMESAVGRDRDGHRHRGPRGASTTMCSGGCRKLGPITSSRSRAEHRDSGRAAPGRLSPGRGTWGGERCSPRLACSPYTRGLVGGGSVGRPRDADGGRVLRRPAPSISAARR